MITDLSAVYMDVVKDRLYAEAPDSPSRRAAQTVLMNILETMVRIMSPILTFTCDEVWEHYPAAERNRAGRAENVQLAGWPTDDDFSPALPQGAEADAFAVRFAALLEVRDAVTKALEDARNAKTVNKSQEAALSIVAPGALYDALAVSAAADLEELFIVAKTYRSRCPRPTPRSARAAGTTARSAEATRIPMSAPVAPPCSTPRANSAHGEVEESIGGEKRRRLSGRRRPLAARGPGDQGLFRERLCARAGFRGGIRPVPIPSGA